MDGTITKICKDCSGPFEITEREQEFFAQRDLSQPKRCKDCRRLLRQLREQQQLDERRA
jgi:hypothetical protein